MRWNIFTMSRWNIFTFLAMLLLAMFLRIQGIMWAASGGMLLGGLIFSLRCYRQSRPVLGAFLWTAVLSAARFLLGMFVPNIRVWELLYI